MDKNEQKNSKKGRNVTQQRNDGNAQQRAGQSAQDGTENR